MLKKKVFVKSFILGAFLLAMVYPSWGQSLDLRAGRYLDTEEYFIGGGLLSRISGNFFFNPNAEYVFVDNFTYMTFNLDFHYDFYTQSALFFWLGSGLGILYTDPGEGVDSDVDLAANLILGLGINTISGLTP